MRGCIIIHGEGKTFLVVEIGLPRGTGCGRFAPHNTFDGGKHLFARGLAEGPDAEAEGGRFRNDVVFSACVQLPNSHHGRITGGDFAGHYPLEPDRGSRGHEDRVHGGFRAGTVPAATVQGDVERIGRCHGNTGAKSEPACGDRRHVLTKDHLGLGDAVVEAVLDHGVRPATELFGRLEDRDQCAMPLLLCPDEFRHGANQAGDVDVVPAGVHDRYLKALVVHTHGSACVVQPGGFLDGQCIHVSTQHHNGALPVPENTHYAGLSDVPVDLEAQTVKVSGHDSSRSHLLERQLRVSVQVFVQFFKVNAHRDAPHSFDAGMASVSGGQWCWSGLGMRDWAAWLIQKRSIPNTPRSRNGPRPWRSPAVHLAEGPGPG